VGIEGEVFGAQAGRAPLTSVRPLGFVWAAIRAEPAPDRKT